MWSFYHRIKLYTHRMAITQNQTLHTSNGSNHSAIHFIVFALFSRRRVTHSLSFAFSQTPSLHWLSSFQPLSHLRACHTTSRQRSTFQHTHTHTHTHGLIAPSHSEEISIECGATLKFQQQQLARVYELHQCLFVLYIRNFNSNNQECVCVYSHLFLCKKSSTTYKIVNNPTTRIEKLFNTHHFSLSKIIVGEAEAEVHSN